MAVYSSQRAGVVLRVSLKMRSTCLFRSRVVPGLVILCRNSLDPPAAGPVLSLHTSRRLGPGGVEWSVSTEAALRPAHSLPPTCFCVANPLLLISHPLLLCRYRFIITIQDHLLVLNNGYQFIIKNIVNT